MAEIKMNWKDYPNFKRSEFVCRCGCGEVNMDADFIQSLQKLRSLYNKPMRITSGYRCENHPKEQAKRAKGQTGTHSMGKAADIAVAGGDAYELNRMIAQFPEFTGVGWNQTGPWNSRFIHVDTSTDTPRPNIWSY